MKSDPCPTGDLGSAIFMDDQAASIFAQKGKSLGRSGKQRVFCEDLRLQRARGQGSCPEQTGPAGFTCRRIEQVVGDRSIRVPPGAGRDP